MAPCLPCSSLLKEPLGEFTAYGISSLRSKGLLGPLLRESEGYDAVGNFNERKLIYSQPTGPGGL